MSKRGSKVSIRSKKALKTQINGLFLSTKSLRSMKLGVLTGGRLYSVRVKIAFWIVFVGGKSYPQLGVLTGV